MELLVDRGTVPALAREAVRRGVGRLGYESHDLTVDGLAGLEKVLADAADGGAVPELASVRRAVEALRAIKDDDEIESLRQACAVADQALAELAAEGALRPGRTELQVGRELDARMLALGAEAPSFETIVAAGANSAIPHHRPDATVLRDGDFLKLDFGATVDGYHSDMTRTVVLGHAADWQREIYELVAASQAAGRAALEVGADVVAIDAAVARRHRRGRPRRALHPRPGPRRGPGDPRGAGDRPAGRGYPGCRHGRHRGAGRLPTRPRRCPDRGHADRHGRRARVVDPHEQGTAGSVMATTNDLKNGIVLNLDGQLWTVTDFQHVKPGKGGAFVRTTLKNVLSGKVVDKTFNAGLKIETANVDKRNMTYLYKDGTDFVFMDGDTFDQIHVSAQTLGAVRTTCSRTPRSPSPSTTTCPLFVELPVTMELVVEHTDPGLQGDRSTGGTKPATLETGAQIQVPLFITTGEKLKVDTRDGRYLGRVN